MKNIKDLIIASALSIMAASCYAGSLVPNTSTGVSADVSFSNPGQLQAQLTPVAGLMAGQHGNGDVIAQLKVSGSIKQFAVTGDYSKPEDVILSGAQTVNADIYPVTLNVAAYQA